MAARAHASRSPNPQSLTPSPESRVPHPVSHVFPNPLIFHIHHGFDAISALFLYNITGYLKTVENRSFFFINIMGYPFIFDVFSLAFSSL